MPCIEVFIDLYDGTRFARFLNYSKRFPSPKIHIVKHTNRSPFNRLINLECSKKPIFVRKLIASFVRCTRIISSVS